MVLDQLGHEEGGEHVALLHLVADVHDPLLDIGVHLRIDRRALITLDEARLPDDPDDVPDLRPDQPHGRGLRDARGVGLFLLAAARRRQDGQEPGEEQPTNKPESWRKLHSFSAFPFGSFAGPRGTAPADEIGCPRLARELRPLRRRGDLHRAAVGRIDRSPRITCSEPLIGIQESADRRRRRAAGDW